jgi:branched-chain amino acid transport system permease protein
MTRSEAMLVAIGAVAFAALACVPWVFGRFGVSLAIAMVSYAVLATAWSLFSGPTNYVSLATAAFFGVGAYSVAVLGETAPMPVVFIAAAAAATILALLVGVATLRLAGVYFVIFTFGLAELVRQLVSWFEVSVSNVLGRYILLDITQEQIYLQLVALLAATFFIGWLINRSRLGFAMRVIGDDETVAAHSGIDTARAKILLFTITAAITAVVGAILAPRWTYLEPSSAFNAMISFQVLVMALLGGTRRLWGPALGVVPLTLLFEMINASFPNYATVLIGITFLLIVYVVPRGVVGVVEDLAAKRVHWRRGAS